MLEFEASEPPPLEEESQASDSSLNEYILDDRSKYIVLGEIGAGTSGKVYLCVDSSSREIGVAIKEVPIGYELDILPSTVIHETVPSIVIREASALKELKHPNIVRLLKVSSRSSFVCLVFEILSCDLRDVFRRDYFPNPKIIKSYMYQMLSAVAYCHAHNILHRDLKPSNILVDVSKKTVKIADFGLAGSMGEYDPPYSYPELGTRGYIAPEVLIGNREYSTPIDVWSLGCIFAEMVSGQRLIRAMDSEEELQEMFKLFGTPTEETWPGVDKLIDHHIPKAPLFPATDLKKKFPDFEPDGLDLLCKMLIMDPAKRISVGDALEHPYFND